MLTQARLSKNTSRRLCVKKAQEKLIEQLFYYFFCHFSKEESVKSIVSPTAVYSRLKTVECRRVYVYV